MKTHQAPISYPAAMAADKTAAIACAIYARVSTTKQAEENTSISVQLEGARKYAASRGWSVFNEYVDAERSGTTDKGRPQFTSMIDEALSPGARFQFILVYDHSRFYRNVGESEVIRFKMALNGVQVQSVTQPIEDDGLTGSLAITIQAAFDQHQSTTTASKVRSGLRASARVLLRGRQGAIWLQARSGRKAWQQDQEQARDRR